MGNLTLRLPTGSAKAHSQRRRPGRLQVHGEGTLGVRRGAGALPVSTPRPQPGAGVRDRVRPELHQVGAAPVAAGHTLQSLAAGPCLPLHPGWSRAQPRTWVGETPVGLGLAKPLAESTWAVFHFLFSWAFAHALPTICSPLLSLPLILLSQVNVTTQGGGLF